MEAQPLYGITELAALSGATPRAIRLYEAKGLLKPRRVNGARVYTAVDRTRLSLILRAKAIGSTLAEIRTFLELYGREGEGREKQLEYVIARTAEKIAELESRRAKIDETLAELRLIHEGSKQRLAARRDR
ncbi:MAG: MerR family DNA-binding transcriptional regulator [Maricaulaceae bacterium]|nr:MerR family DNA-binding transcriptional regulator [Maricaulaceae bacterium]